MIARKVLGFSPLLGRDFHADLFEPRREPAVLVVFFGGSGVDAATYRDRSASLVPLFDESLARLEREACLAFAYVTSPPDLSIRGLGGEADDVARWREHTQAELLPLLPRLPVYAAGYSGGVALAYWGLCGETDAVVGLGGLGGDQISEELCSGTWAEPATFWYNGDDPVFAPNRRVVTDLCAAGEARCIRKAPGGHGLSDYLRNGSFDGLLRQAWRVRCG